MNIVATLKKQNLPRFLLWYLFSHLLEIKYLIPAVIFVHLRLKKQCLAFYVKQSFFMVKILRLSMLSCHLFIVLCFRLPFLNFNERLDVIKKIVFVLVTFIILL